MNMKYFLIAAMATIFSTDMVYPMLTPRSAQRSAFQAQESQIRSDIREENLELRSGIAVDASKNLVSHVRRLEQSEADKRKIITTQDDLLTALRANRELANVSVAETTVARIGASCGSIGAMFGAATAAILLFKEVKK